MSFDIVWKTGEDDEQTGVKGEFDEIGDQV